MSDDEAPAGDELFVLELIARRAGVPLPTSASSAPPPRPASHVRATARPIERREEEPDERATSDDEYPRPLCGRSFVR